MKHLATAFATAGALSLAGAPAYAQETLAIEFVATTPGYPAGTTEPKGCLSALHQTFAGAGADMVRETDHGRWYTIEDGAGMGKILLYCADTPGMIALGFRFRPGAERFPNLNFETERYTSRADCIRRANRTAGSGAYLPMASHQGGVTFRNPKTNLAVTIVCSAFGEVMFAAWGRGSLSAEREAAQHVWHAS